MFNHKLCVNILSLLFTHIKSSLSKVGGVCGQRMYHQWHGLSPEKSNARVNKERGRGKEVRYQSG